MNRPEITKNVGMRTVRFGDSEPVFATLLHPGRPSYFLVVTSIPKKDQDMARSRDEIADRRVSLRSPVGVG